MGKYGFYKTNVGLKDRGKRIKYITILKKIVLKIVLNNLSECCLHVK